MRPMAETTQNFNEAFFEEEEQQKSLRDYLGVIGRNKRSILAVWFGFWVLTIVIALLLPPTYRSTATVLIEEQDIPSELVMSTISSFAEQRIQVINAKVMTRTNLMQLIKKYDLYADEREIETSEEIVERMREDTALNTISADVVDPRSGRPTTATIAFSIAYQNEKPLLAVKVANELTTLYLNENLRNRTEKATETAQFLANESLRISKEIGGLETELAAFKEQHTESLPEFKEYNLQLTQRLDREIMDMESQLRSLTDREFYLEGELAKIDPASQLFSSTGERIYSPIDRLKTLETDYLQMKNRYQSSHPELVRMRKEIEALKGNIGGSDSAKTQYSELQRLRTELTSMLERYKPTHPDINKLRQSIASLESTVNQGSNIRSPFLEDPDNPAYITLKAQMKSVGSDIVAIKNSLVKQKRKLDLAEKRMTGSPQIEREYLTLVRDYDNAVLKYREVKAKQMEAQISQQLEQENKGERFSLIEPAEFPEEPIKPNRPVLITLGFLLALAIAMAQAFIRESVSGAVYTPRDIMALQGFFPLAEIPYYENDADKSRRMGMRYSLMFGFIAVVAIGLAAIHFLFSPLDVMWFRVLRKLDILFL